MKRKLTSLCLIVVVSLLSLGAERCSKSQAQIADGIGDVVLSVESARPFLSEAARLIADKIIERGHKAEAFVRNGNFADAGTTMDEIVALFGSIAVGENVRRYLALGNIALHFVIRRIKEKVPQLIAPGASAFETEPVWGLNYSIPPELMKKSKTKGKL